MARGRLGHSLVTIVLRLSAPLSSWLQAPAAGPPQPPPPWLIVPWCQVGPSPWETLAEACKWKGREVRCSFALSSPRRGLFLRGSGHVLSSGCTTGELASSLPLGSRIASSLCPNKPSEAILILSEV